MDRSESQPFAVNPYPTQPAFPPEADMDEANSSDTQNTLKHTGEQVKEGVKKMAEQARTKTTDAIEKQKNSMADQVGGFAAVLHNTADELNDRQQTSLAHHTHGMASRLDDLAGALHGQNIGDLLDQIQDFAKRRPGLFIGGTVVAGFLLARFLKSSGSHGHDNTQYSREYEDAEPIAIEDTGDFPAEPRDYYSSPIV